MQQLKEKDRDREKRESKKEREKEREQERERERKSSLRGSLVKAAATQGAPYSSGVVAICKIMPLASCHVRLPCCVQYVRTECTHTHTHTRARTHSQAGVLRNSLYASKHTHTHTHTSSETLDSSPSNI